MQEKLRNFYDDFGKRIAFLREKVGLTLGQLADGSASTAKSWEEGSLPGADKWEAIAKRLRLSVSFVFLGRPVAKEDFDFVAKFTDEIGPAPNGAQPPAHNALQESATAYGTVDAIEAEIRRHVEVLIASAKGDRDRLGWALEQARAHLTTPAHWRSVSPRLVRIQPKTETQQPHPSSSHQPRSA